MEISKKYNPALVEDKWYAYWMEQGFFDSIPDEREPYTIVIPPPNVTGILHMGHMLNNTIQDVLIRRARMRGYNVCWVPGTDHASIATEAKVVRKLREEGIKKSDLSRDDFMGHAWDWTNKHGGIILEQLKKLGASCDWKRTDFTMNDDYYNSVIDVFIDLYEKGKIYRGVRMVNWDPAAKTALSDEEVIHKQISSMLYYVRYRVAGDEDEWLTVATTRPETILGDTAICINPKDDRYLHLHGKKAIVPIANREIPIILDEYVDMEFGTGCLKVTPAHDQNDYELGKKHNLETIDILHANGVLNEHGLHYEGQDRFEARKTIAKELDESGYLVKTEDHVNKLGFSERTDAVIEPRLSMQWFCSMEELSGPALENVINGNIKFHPANLVNTYRHWMENIRDWCVSRQLWWGHRIPAWYFGEGDDDFVVAKTEEDALQKAREKSGNADLAATDLRQEEDVMDTWFSSWLWPISVFNGLNEPGNKDISYYYPTADLVTAPEIMFFWVARMIMAGYEYLGEKPFSNVYFTGIVRDKLGRKMSKSLGNSPDPLVLIEKFGADAVRTGMLFSSPAGNDLLFNVAECEQGQRFNNKIWNAFRLVKGWEVKDLDQPEASARGVEWFQHRFQQTLAQIDAQYEQFRISDALMSIYKLFWDDFCAIYLEIIKPGYEAPIDRKTYDATIAFFEDLLKVLHPLMPFISEEIWGLIGPREHNERLIVTEWPAQTGFDQAILDRFDRANEVVGGVRNIRSEYNIAPKVAIPLSILKSEQNDPMYDEVVRKLANISTLEYIAEEPTDAVSFMTGSTATQYYAHIDSSIDKGAQKKELQEDLNYLRGFLKSVEKKLSNERFVSGAPEAVVDKERQKQADTAAKIKVIEEMLSSL